MKTIKLKTNINCSSCLSKVKPFLDQAEVDSWNVDLQNPDKVLSVSGNVSAEEIIKKVSEAGFKAEPAV